MPLFFHGLDIVCINSFIVCQQLGWKPSRSATSKSQHKEHTRDFIQASIAKGETHEMRAMRHTVIGSKIRVCISSQQKGKDKHKEPNTS